MQIKLAMLVLTASVILAQSPVPRPAGALSIGGKDFLAQAAGRPVVLAFVSTQCSHCAAVARVMEEASKEYRSVLFEAVAFDDNADPTAWARKLGLNFPVYATDRQSAMKFLGLTDSRLGTPQMVYIDSSRVVRAQSERLGTPMLQSPDYMRSIVAALLKGSHDR